jgi:hypothetical protein
MEEQKFKIMELNKVKTRNKGLGYHSNLFTSDDNANNGADHHQIFDYSLLKMPHNRNLETIFLRDGPFDFLAYNYPSDIELDKLYCTKVTQINN